MPENTSNFTTKPKKITSSGEFAWGGESGWGEDIEESENITVGSNGIRPGNAIPDTATHQWAFNAGSGTTVHDQIGDRNINFSSMEWETEVGTKDVVGFLDGGSDGGIIESSASMINFTENIEGGFGIWIRPDAFEQAGVLLGSWNIYDTNDANISFRYGASDILFRAGTSGGENGDIAKFSAPHGFTKGNWHSVALLGDGSVYKVLVYGVRVGSQTASATSSDNYDEYLSVGFRGSDGSARVNGAIDNAWWSETPVTEEEVQTWHESSAHRYP